MKKKIFTGGISGVGKTSIFHEVKKLYDDFESVNFGKYFSEFMDMDRDTIRSLVSSDDIRFYHQKQLDVYRKFMEILEASKKSVVAIDSHYSILMDNNDFIIGFPTYAIDLVKPDALVLIEADVKLVEEHRRYDESRNRRSFKDIPKELEMESRYAKKCSVYSGVPLQIIQIERLKKLRMNLLR